MRIRETAKNSLTRIYCSLRIRAWMTTVFAAAWWGILYPELCFTEETCEAVMASDSEQAEDEQETVQQNRVWRADAEQTAYIELLEATGDDIIVSSRFVEWLLQYLDE